MRTSRVVGRGVADRAIPKQSSVWDKHRNTSQVFPVPPDALPAALRSLAALRRDQPALVKWLADGHPTLTDAEHLERFGEPYRGVRSRRRWLSSCAATCATVTVRRAR